MIQNKIIIWSADNYNSLGLLRQLGGREFEIFFVVNGGLAGCASKSKFFGSHIITDSIEEGYEYIISHFTNEANKPVIITPSDEIAEFMDQHREELSLHFIVPGTKESGLLTKIDDKNNMGKLAEECGFLVPQSRFVRYDSEIDGIEYPCIIKPTHTTPGHRNEFKYRICNNARELSNLLKLVRKESEFVLQQYIPKESVALVYGCRYIDGEIALAGILLKDRFLDCGDGSHGIITNTFPKGIDTDCIKSFFNAIDYCGLFSVEYGMYQGKAYFFEVNLRNDGTSHLFYQAGANIPLSWVTNVIGKDIENIPTCVNKESWFIDEVFDIANVFKHNVSYKRWKRERAAATVFKYYDKGDVEPWKSVKSQRWKKMVKDYIVLKFRPYIVYLLDLRKK